MHGDLDLLINLSVIFVLALALGLVTERLRLSPIVGYLLAGVILAPKIPGIDADPHMAAQFAEIGVILLMFGVGLHFNLKELFDVRQIAIPGAVGQITVATSVGALAVWVFGWPPSAAWVIGVAISVASTVVLVRVLMDNNLLDTEHGHIAIGWLIVEDIFTVLVLVILPALGSQTNGGEQAATGVLWPIVFAIIKLCLLAFVVVVGGRKVIPWLLTHVARTGSRELFTLSVLAIALAIATGSAVLFDVSMALGAFLAGTVVGQTQVSHQAAADALPLRDAFAVLFFVSVGMLFDPDVLTNHLGLMLSLLGVILIAKPLAAFLIVWFLGYSVRSGLVVAAALSQIGEFSFLLASEAAHADLMPEDGQSLLVACAIISITINPLLFPVINVLERQLRKREAIWTLLSRRSEQGGMGATAITQARLMERTADGKEQTLAVVIGYGPVGQTAARILKSFDIRPVMIDLNPDTVRRLVESGEAAVYGDATRREILEAAGIVRAKYLLVTIPDLITRTVVIMTAKNENPGIHVIVRARYLQERAWLEEVGATEICTEEAATALGMAVLLLHKVGADEDRIRQEVDRIQKEMSLPLFPM